MFKMNKIKSMSIGHPSFYPYPMLLLKFAEILAARLCLLAVNKDNTING